MRVAFMALIFFILILIISGSMTYPNQEDLILMFSSFSILVMSWLYVKETKKDQEKEKNEVKTDTSEV
jgi:positive regulator of sigma E activity